MKALKVLAVCGLAFVAAWMVMYPSSRYRFRLTINVDTPSGLKSGSSVMEVNVQRFPAWNAMRSGPPVTQGRLDGEAIFIDLGPDESGNRRNLVTLLGFGPRGDNYDFFLLPDRVYDKYLVQKFREDFDREMANKYSFDGPPYGLQKARNQNRCTDRACELEKIATGTRVEVSWGKIPTLVTFPDLKDPTNFTVVDVTNIGREFGPGFQLRNATFEFVPAGTWPLTWVDLSGEPLTRGIEKSLPLISNIKRDESFTTARTPIRFEIGHFKRGH